MAMLTPFFRLVRWPNLLFIILTQVLFEYCIYHPIYKGMIPPHNTFQFVLLVVASVFIAAAGYIINDYFDINIDLINKPNKLVLGKTFSRRWALLWHLVLSILGIFCTALAVRSTGWHLIIANMVCVVLLWFYSARFKRDVLIGNIVVSLLTAWTIMIIFFSKYSFYNAFGNGDSNQIRLFRFTILYAGFAFIISLVREAVKDIEDLRGDEKYGCKTMPVVWGVNGTKIYIAVWITILIAMLVIVQIYVLQFRWWAAVIYSVLLIVFPLFYFFRRLVQASNTQEYHQLSNLAKGIMLAGITSMLFFYFYL